MTVDAYEATARDVRAGREAILRVAPTLDATTAYLCAVAAVQAARPAMWLEKDRELERLREEVSALRAHLTGGICANCGSRMVTG